MPQNYDLYICYHASPSFSNAHARKMSQFHSLIRSRDSRLNPQILLFVEFVGTTTSMPDLTNGWLEYVTCTNKTHKNLLFIMYVVFFEDNYIFVNNFNTSPRSYKCIP